MKPFQNFTDREHTLAKLARGIGRGHGAIYHGTRHPKEVLRSGKLKPDPTSKISLSRSPEVAAHFALLPDDGIVRWSPAVLVLNRSSLIQTYRLEPWRYDEDWDDEQEEVIWDRIVTFRRHLLGVVGEAEITKILGAPKRMSSGRQPDSATYREALKAGDSLVRGGRARVRNLIVRERKQRSIENARLPAAALEDSCPACRRCRKVDCRFEQGCQGDTVPELKAPIGELP
jgi:hypothetical protein